MIFIELVFWSQQSFLISQDGIWQASFLEMVHDSDSWTRKLQPLSEALNFFQGIMERLKRNLNADNYWLTWLNDRGRCNFITSRCIEAKKPVKSILCPSKEKKRWMPGWVWNGMEWSVDSFIRNLEHKYH